MSIVRRNVLDTVPVLISSSMNKKLQKKLSPILNERLGSLNDTELEELFRQDKIITTKRQQLENQKKVGSSRLDIMHFQLRKVIT